MVIIPSSNKVVSFYGNDDNQYCYVPILKNAHTWGIEFFSDYNFVETLNFRNKFYIVFLRNPINRWLSGTAQWFDNNVEYKESFTLDTMFKKILLDAVSFDGHTESQLNYLFGLPLAKCVFFNIDDERFEFKLKHFVKLKFNLPFVDRIIPKKNVMIESKFKTVIFNELSTLIKTEPKFYNRLRLYYSADFDLINSGHFYDPFKQ